MKSLLLFPALACLSVVISPRAVRADEEGGKFEEHKQRMISSLDGRIAALNEAKSCAQAASSKEALKGCHEKLKSAQEAMVEKFIDSRIDRLQKRKAEMKAKKGY